MLFGWNRIVLPLAIVLASGCSTYMEAKDATRKGGSIDQQKTAANAQLAAAQAQNTTLQDELLNRNREIERMDRRIAAGQTELNQQEKLLARALQSRKISQSRHDQLKRELSAIQAETSTIDLQNKMDMGSKTGNSAADAEKERKLVALEKRKKELEAAFAASLRK